MNSITLLKLQFTLTFSQNTYLPAFIGNTIRGSIGRSLFDNHRAAYDAVFKVAGGDSIPNPFVLSAPYPGKAEYAAGDTLVFSITLFGVACVYEQEIISAAQMMCGGKLAEAKLTDVVREYYREWSDGYLDIIQPCDALLLKFASPTEIISRNYAVYEPDFISFINVLFSRIAAICDNYGKNEFVLPYSLVARRPQVSAEYQLRHVRINSNNQPIDGFIGSIKYWGDITRYIPYIELGSLMHVGKKTTRSCGEYSFEI